MSPVINRRGYLACAWLAASGCTSSDGFVPLPTQAGGESAIVIASDGTGQVFDAWASNADDPTFITGEPVSLTLLLYRDTLESLGLEVGSMRALSECEKRCSLRSFQSAFTLSLENDDAQSEWRPIDVPPTLVEDWLVPNHALRCTACRQFEEIEVPLPIAPDINVTFTVRADDGSVLVGTRRGAIFRVNANLEVERICSETPNELTFTAVPDRDDVLWVTKLGGVLGKMRLSEQTPDLPCTIETSTSGTSGVARASVISETSPREIYIYYDTGAIMRFDESGRTHVGSLPEDSEEDLVWLSPRHVAAVNGTDELLRIEGDTAQVEKVASTLADQPELLAISYQPGMGLALGTKSEGIMIETEDGWVGEALDGWTDPGAIIPYNGGFFYTPRPGDSASTTRTKTGAARGGIAREAPPASARSAST